jgi:Copper type II ascorbate-dependent monooxygenase, N-terminal domain/Copper type II ascorbate-dependent monooxygenase, C-terminal domain
MAVALVASMPDLSRAIATLGIVLATAAACSSSPSNATGDGASSGSSGASSSSGGAGGGGLPCDVDAILAKSCRQCHGATPAFGAPMPLVTLADLSAPSKTDPTKTVAQKVEQRIHDDAAPMPQAPSPRLSASDTAVLDQWIAAGAKGDGAACAPAADAGTTPPTTLSCKPDVSVRPGAAWAMPQTATDQYVCYGFDAPTTAARQIVGFQPRIDNTKIVHHVLLYQADAAVSPTPTACQGGAVGTNKLLYGWAPGGEAFELPAEAGYPMATGTTHYLVQVHYNNIQGLAGQTDSSGFDLCSTDQLRPNAADVLAFGSVNFSIPPHQTVDVTCDLKVAATTPEMHVISAFPHMHQLGTVIETTATPAAGGADVSLGGVAQWSFSNQLWFPLAQTVHPGDTVHTRCAWNNTTDATVKFGETTEDEMCFSFTMYYPADAAIKSWIVPSIASKCHPTAP